MYDTLVFTDTEVIIVILYHTAIHAITMQNAHTLLFTDTEVITVTLYMFTDTEVITLTLYHTAIHAITSHHNAECRHTNVYRH